MERAGPGCRRLLRPGVTMAPHPASGLPTASAVLAVIAHPDDESFGLGAVFRALTDAGTRVTGLCFTHGEASTLGAAGVDLHQIRATELAEAAKALGISAIDLLGYPDGQLADIPLAELADLVVGAAVRCRAELLVVFDEGGVTGHPDHQHATRAALAASHRLGLPVAAWAVPDTVAAALNAEFSTTFVGRPPNEIDLVVTVDRVPQLTGLACHRSRRGRTRSCGVAWS